MLEEVAESGFGYSVREVGGFATRLLPALFLLIPNFRIIFSKVLNAA